MEFDRFLKYYENAEDLNMREGTGQNAEMPRREDGTRERRSAS